MLIVNLITEFRVSIFQQFLGIEPTLVARVVTLGVEEKAFCLFALLFGVGLAIQFDRFSRTGAPLHWLVRRLVVLLVFGLVHLLLIWNGDILTAYAIGGLLVLPLLLGPSWLLAVAALILLVLYASAPVLPWSIPLPNAATLQQHVAEANQVYSTGSLAEIWRFSIRELPLLLPLHVSVFPRTLALFLFGALLWRAGILKQPYQFRHPMMAAAVVGIVAGGVLSSADAWGPAFLSNLAPVVLALGYGAAVMAIAQLPAAQRWLSVFAPMGRMTFTNYLMQSLVFGFVFFGYGLGQFGRMDAAAALILGVFVYAAQLLLSAWWLRRFRFGPVEWLWRSLTYGKQQPMRIGHHYG